MTPRQPDAETRTATDLFRERLDNMLNQRHALYRLADLPDWSVFDKEFGTLYCLDNGCPGKPTRLLVGLQYLKHCYGYPMRRWYRAGWKIRQYKRLRRDVKQLRTYLGQVVRDSGRKRRVMRPNRPPLPRSWPWRSGCWLSRRRIKTSSTACLPGTQGDQLNVLLSCAGYNLRLVLNRLRLFCLRNALRRVVWQRLWGASYCLSSRLIPATAA